jgi:hypothetical protein
MDWGAAAHAIRTQVEQRAAGAYTVFSATLPWRRSPHQLGIDTPVS